MNQSTSNSIFIRAGANTIYQAFANPDALQEWMAPGVMKATLHHYDWREGGSYEMSLFYAEQDQKHHGKSSDKEDRYTANIISLKPGKQIILSNKFNNVDAQFAGEMMLDISFHEQAGGTDVSFTFTNIPAGIKPEDNEKGTAETLQQLKNYVEKGYAKEKESPEIDEQGSDGSANAFASK